jgi:uncharacterized protein (TIGR03083 family)
MLGAGSISVVLDVYRPERRSLLDLLNGLTLDDWRRPTECPSYSVKGIATHILGDDLSLLSRQRDGAESGLVSLAREMTGSDFRTLLDAFNDRWVATAAFVSNALLIELLQLTGEWTALFYEGVDPNAQGEAVGIFGAKRGTASPFWQAVAREYLERWTHHSQIRRAMSFSSVSERRFLVPGIEVAAAVTRLEPGVPSDPNEAWALGPLVLGPAGQTADILTRAHTTDEVRALVDGPDKTVEVFAALVRR